MSTTAERTGRTVIAAYGTPRNHPGQCTAGSARHASAEPAGPRQFHLYGLVALSAGRPLSPCP